MKKMKDWTKKMKCAALAGVLAAGLTTFGGIADNLDQILGTYREAASGKDPDYCYTEISPTTTYVLPSGEITTKKIESGCRYTR